MPQSNTIQGTLEALGFKRDDVAIDENDNTKGVGIWTRDSDGACLLEVLTQDSRNGGVQYGTVFAPVAAGLPEQQQIAALVNMYGRSS